ncbi:DUF3124 domain-containing protein [Desulfopila aestuarii]|uniref:DUF3124 domain-containing protein n=1 Tax=Desulfopila aestuarii DSM 18488 TaxID=1121416 RepID=A0A1M7Y528_9BACT|nr:DUF3124 domain-containing protein [Desulfopila aestuarii]SHO47523.1 Protein of unknown function [Desulfopila aestuarii DSM 18488]
MKTKLPGIYLLLLAAISLLLPTLLFASGEDGLSKGQTVYVPAYSHIYSGNREQPFLLTVTLSIRNIDPKHTLTINLVDYYETQGKLLKNCIEKPFQLGPLESFRYIIPEKDKSGGSGANFMVEWNSTENSNPPIIETIMIGAQFQQGISFTSRGQAIVNQ